MVVGIDLFDWEQLGFPEIPQLLLSLTGTDEKVQNYSYSTIQTDVVLGKLSFEYVDMGYGAKEILNTDVHVLLAPILIQLLRETNRHAQHLILSLLAEMTLYVLLKDADDASLERARRVHSIIWGGLELYLEFLNGDDEALVATTGYLLTRYPEYILYLLPTFERNIKRLSGDAQRAKLIWYVHEALQGVDMPKTILSLLLEYIEEGSDSISRTTASLCLVDRLRINAPPMAIDEVTQLAKKLDTRSVEILTPGYEIARELLKSL